MLGERALVTEGGCFTAGATFHVGCPFNTMIPVLALSFLSKGQYLFSKARDFTIYRNHIQDILLK
jgi:hypothetical protein